MSPFLTEYFEDELWMKGPDSRKLVSKYLMQVALGTNELALLPHHLGPEHP